MEIAIFSDSLTVYDDAVPSSLHQSPMQISKKDFHRMKNLRSLLSPALALPLLFIGTGAFAQYATYSAPVSTFVLNSAIDAGAQGALYLSAQGVPTEFLSFSTDKNGNTITAGNNAVNGNIFSNNVTFSSLASSTFGGTASSQIQLGNSPSIGSEIGPFGAFTGILNINFLANGNSASAVGFGPVVFNARGDVIRVYDENNALQATYTADPANFSFFGIVQQGNGPLIGRVELDGNFFGIQDLQFKLGTRNAVPEPSAVVMFSGLAAVGMGFMMKRRRSKTVRSV